MTEGVYDGHADDREDHTGLQTAPDCIYVVAAALEQQTIAGAIADSTMPQKQQGKAT